jgi:MFS family permease
MIGRALGAAIAGALFGPVIGTIATATGRPAAFGMLVIAAVLLIVATGRLPLHHTHSEQGFGSLRRAIRGPGIRIGMWLVALPAIASGMLNVLGPLRLHRFGAAAAAIGATYVVAAAVEATISPAVGSLSDRHGRRGPLRFGLVLAAATLLCFTLPGTAGPLAVVIVAICAALGIFWAPAMALLSDAAEAQGLDQGLAAALMNLAWAGGQIAGSGGGGAAAKVVGDGLPMAVAAGLCAVTLLLMGRLSGRHVVLSAGATVPSSATPDRPRSRA